MSRSASTLGRIWLMTLVTGTAPVTARAQEATRLVYFAPGHEVGREAKSQTYAAGLGLQRTLENHLAIQVDIAALSYVDANDSRTVVGIASFDAVFFHVLRQRTVELFGVAGYSLQFRDYTTNMFNYGGGLRHWFREDRALLVEIRDHKAKEQSILDHFWSVRIGLVFR